MNDETLVRLLQETSKALGEMDGFVSCNAVVGSYNAVLKAIQRNHPLDEFFSALTPLENGGKDHTAGEMHILFAQLRIVLESGRANSTADR